MLFNFYFIFFSHVVYVLFTDSISSSDFLRHARLLMFFHSHSSKGPTFVDSAGRPIPFDGVDDNGVSFSDLLGSGDSLPPSDGSSPAVSTLPECGSLPNRREGISHFIVFPFFSDL